MRPVVIVAARKLHKHTRLVADRPGVVPRRQHHNVVAAEILLGTVVHQHLQRAGQNFVEIPSLSAAMTAAKNKGCLVDLDTVLYIAGKDEIVPSEAAPGRSFGMSAWRRGLFGSMYRNAVRASNRFDLSRDRLIEIGRQVEV